MLGQAHTLGRRLVPLAVAAVAIPVGLLAVAGSSGADPSQSAASLRALDAQLAAKQRSAVLGLYALDQQLTAAQARLDTLHEQAAALRARRAVLTRELAVARSGSKIAQRRLDHRLLMLYERRSVTPIEILFGAESLDQALNDLANLNSVSAQDQAVLREVKSARRQLAAVGRGLAARSAGIASATRQAEATAQSLAATRSQRGSYIASIADRRRLTESQVAQIVDRARAAAERTAALERSARRTPAPAPVAVSDLSSPLAPTSAVSDGGQELTVTATGYSLSGATATGLPVGWGVAAVDPSIIPLGSHMVVPGYGEAVAADTGGAISGDTIDLWFPTTAQAAAWGRRTVTIELR